MPDAFGSIVIPAYNPTALLLEAMASAAAQTHPRTEIILINDGSDQPESLAILEQAARSAGTYLEQSNQGPSAARNAAFRIAQADYVVAAGRRRSFKPNLHCDLSLGAGCRPRFRLHRLSGDWRRSLCRAPRGLQPLSLARSQLSDLCGAAAKAGLGAGRRLRRSHAARL